MTDLWHLPVLVFVAFILTAVLRAYALRRNVLDIPNERSSHQRPTPRGGGVAVVLTFSCYLLYLWLQHALNTALVLPLLCSGLLVAVIGFLDDHGHIDARWRLLVHFSAAALVVYCSNGLPVLTFFGLEVNFGIAGYVLALLGVVWVLNLVNFMDGIDGIAGVQAISACLVLTVLIYLQQPSAWLIALHLGLAAAVAGFLLWNLPPARIFMGDAGSGFIGLSLASLTLLAGQHQSNLFWCWLIMLAVFIVDATYTLIVRLCRGQQFYQAHRSHAYQHAAMRAGKHWPVTYSVLLINLLWLAPWCWAVVQYSFDGALALCLAYLPLIFLARYFKAGRNEC